MSTDCPDFGPLREAPAQQARLLAPDEPPAVMALERESSSPFVIVVDHAGRRLPAALATLGLPPSELERHIAWDIGALAVAQRVAAALDAALVWQNYSRLVIDCNRDPRVPSSIPTIGECTEIPGNRAITAADAAMRRREIFDPYHSYIHDLLDARLAAGRETILIAQHSMTPVFKGIARPMHAALLYNRDRRFTGLLLDRLRAEPCLMVAENEPYFVSDETDYTIPVHAEARRLPYAEIEIRQDLIEEETGQRLWAERIVRALAAAALELAQQRGR